MGIISLSSLITSQITLATSELWPFIYTKQWQFSSVHSLTLTVVVWSSWNLRKMFMGIISRTSLITSQIPLAFHSFGPLCKTSSCWCNMWPINYFAMKHGACYDNWYYGHIMFWLAVLLLQLGSIPNTCRWL